MREPSSGKGSGQRRRRSHSVLMTRQPAVLFVPQFLSLEHGHPHSEDRTWGRIQEKYQVSLPLSGGADQRGPASHTELRRGGQCAEKGPDKEGHAGIHGGPRRAKTLGAASQFRISSLELRRHQGPALSTPRGPRPTYLCVLAKGAKSPRAETDRQARWGPALTAALASSTDSSSHASRRPLECLLGPRGRPLDGSL